jgi:hypothetical protein
MRIEDATMDRDDIQFGYVLTRREALALLGSTTLMMLTGCSRLASRSTQSTATLDIALQIA